jgi:hypothetical protein
VKRPDGRKEQIDSSRFLGKGGCRVFSISSEKRRKEG